MGTAGKRRKGRKHLPKVESPPGRLGNGQNPFGVWYGAAPWPHGHRMQPDQRAAVKVVGLIVGILVLVIVAWALIAG